MDHFDLHTDQENDLHSDHFDSHTDHFDPHTDHFDPHTDQSDPCADHNFLQCSLSNAHVHGSARANNGGLFLVTSKRLLLILRENISLQKGLS